MKKIFWGPDVALQVGQPRWTERCTLASGGCASAAKNEATPRTSRGEIRVNEAVFTVTEHHRSVTEVSNARRLKTPGSADPSSELAPWPCPPTDRRG